MDRNRAMEILDEGSNVFSSAGGIVRLDEWEKNYNGSREERFFIHSYVECIKEINSRSSSHRTFGYVSDEFKKNVLEKYFNSQEVKGIF